MNLVDHFCNTLNYGLFPPVCQLCGNPGLPALDLCALCRDAFPGRPPPWLTAHGLVSAAFHYRAPVDGLIQAFKFHEQLQAGRLLARLASPGLPSERPHGLIPIPLHVRRLRQRGFNQSLELARYWGRQHGLPVLRPALQRHRDTAVQSGLDAAERLPNVRGAFRAGPGLPAHVALVDDVVTTGATCAAAAEALMAAGVQRVDVWCLARVV